MSALAWLCILILVLSFLWLGWCLHDAEEIGPDHPEYLPDRERLP